MANDVTKNPHIIDTAAGTMVVSGEVRVAKVRWVGATTAGHTAVIQDAASRVLWESFAAGVNNVEADTFDPLQRWETGYKVPTLASGKLYIYYA